ncbi:protein-glutamate O-methyltransferase CheR [Desemzia sp. RIT804]|uniref:CheR family methyltransferase n=1 Tax=Desemzia sp. RIT 804 TaxID=2810209 RepID=UPI00194FB04D|nr:protein-glutamate O-methyltransferase CheR [Desemzia sp. RIT 804]MBM6614721.1 protein-glutamate O-methyltransferase CheR [Desemzia sp. RIT 804]
MELNYEFFYQWTTKNLKLNLDGYKETQLQRRIATSMKNAGAETLEEYADVIKANPEAKQKFLDYITINVTDFFRNKDIFEEFEEQLISELLPKFPSLKIWSAACSTGAEAYSIAMILAKHQVKLQNKILATDIDETILQKARVGVYNEYELKNLEYNLRDKYFQEKDGKYEVNKSIKHTVEFKRHDLISDDYPKNYHVIVCRNVMIYFKNEVKNDIYRKISDSLVPGGLYFAGATETIYNPTQYNLTKVTSFIYQKDA